MMTKEQAREFASSNNISAISITIQTLTSSYSDDVLYLDPAIPKGVCGKDELLSYFRKSLAQNPDWTWTQIEPIPMEGGFLNKWLAKIPVGAKTIECIGVCFVQFNDDGLIRRNEVYFDRSELISEIYKYQKSK